jgi:hypothetical protein
LLAAVFAGRAPSAVGHIRAAHAGCGGVVKRRSKSTVTAGAPIGSRVDVGVRDRNLYALTDSRARTCQESQAQTHRSAGEDARQAASIDGAYAMRSAKF